ncbi:hypothetical protein BuS5_00644 [Desulfosarcina sp. BuS5]|nr:hypothetical protein BuS5_00644 [Desulfosarcina sp. BuS5]
MVEIQKKDNPFISDVDKVEIQIDNLPLDAAGRVKPETLHEARFSIYFLAALSLAEGKVTTENLTEEKLSSPEIEALRKKITTHGFFNICLSSHVKVHMKDGTIYEGQTSAPKGSSDNPLTAGELKDKFMITSGLSPGRAKKVIERVMELENVESAAEILSLIRQE